MVWLGCMVQENDFRISVVFCVTGECLIEEMLKSMKRISNLVSNIWYKNTEPSSG